MASRLLLRFSSALALPTGYSIFKALPKSRLDEPENGRGAEAKADERREIINGYAKEFCRFADFSPSVYHAVDTSKTYLLHRGFVELHEKDAWAENIIPGGRYFVTRSGSSGSSIIAFAVGEKWQPGNPFSIIATHVDSPCLKVKPRSDRTSNGFRQLDVETYGGGLWHTWFDRDLGAAGRAYVRTGPTTIKSQLFMLDEPILRVPSLAVHYEHQNPFKFDTEANLMPIIGQTFAEPSKEDLKSTIPNDLEPQLSALHYSVTGAKRRHVKTLVRTLLERSCASPLVSRLDSIVVVHRIAAQLNTHPKNIIDFDLSLYDIQKATLGGLNNEFIFSARIDNLMMTFCALRGFLNSLNSPDALKDERSIRTLAMFDNEEIGSTGSLSAQSTFLPSTLQRISTSLAPADGKGESHLAQSLARSLLISADMNHGAHPNYFNHHNPNHKPLLNYGMILASTSRRGLAKSTADTIRLLEMICKLPDGEQPPVAQWFAFPNGRDCGSTVGPHLEAKLGIRVVEMGNAALSMHSIREMAGSHDVENAIRFLRLFYDNYSEYEEWVVVK